MDYTYSHLTQAELNECIRRGRRAQSEAITALFRRIWSKLTHRPEAPAKTPSHAKYA